MNKFIIFLFGLLLSVSSFAAIQRAYVAGGCFWCTEHDMEKIPGVIKVISGYSGGDRKNPTYKEVSAGRTGHRESILIEYDDSKITYAQLIYDFLKTIDPTDGEGQFVDRGFQYSPAIFFQTESEKKTVLKELNDIKKEGNFPVINVAVVPFKNFYPAEEYHQDYSKKHPFKYEYYRNRSGRDQFLEKVWGKEKSSR